MSLRLHPLALDPPFGDAAAAPIQTRTMRPAALLLIMLVAAAVLAAHAMTEEEEDEAEMESARMWQRTGESIRQCEADRRLSTVHCG